MRASLQTLVILGTAVLTGCTVTMAPPGQNTAANPAMTPQTTVVETKAIPVVERRSAIRATGYAVISVQPSDVDAQQRLLAIRASKLDAYRGLTEQVYGQYLDATTTVADMAVLSDTFRTQVEGSFMGPKSSALRLWVKIPTKPPCRWIKTSLTICAPCIWRRWQAGRNGSNHALFARHHM